MDNETLRLKESDLQIAADLLKAGELVAFPTETVYGLGARAEDSAAVSRVFQVKGRPQNKALIVLIASIDQLLDLVSEVNPIAQRLIDSFWPGPLTIVFPIESQRLPSNVTAGLNNVAVRMPGQPLTRALIERVGSPLVGPSANLSGRPSPTSPDHVLADFDGKIAAILELEDASAQIGVESTIVKVTADQVTILRPGTITKADLSSVVPVPVVETQGLDQPHSSSAKSADIPAMPVYQLQGQLEAQVWIDRLSSLEGSIGVMADDDILASITQLPSVVATYSLGPRGDFHRANARFYAGLRGVKV